jgi:vancomycin resistance protein VanW
MMQTQYRQIRRRLGRVFYSWKRWVEWQWVDKCFARTISNPLQHLVFQHDSILLRPLKGVDMYLQHNKVTNLNLAAERLHGLVIQPGETFSFWRLVGKPTARRGFLEGLVLENGRIGKGIGGGLCQMGNLIYWMALHSPLTVTERWRHSYDVFPDVGRSLPFGSGATLAWNYIDLQLRNDTKQPFQLCIWLSETHLHGEIRSAEALTETYEIVEKDHQIRHENWGGYSRHNRLERRVLDAENRLIREEVVAENHALMMYQPFLNDEL